MKKEEDYYEQLIEKEKGKESEWIKESFEKPNKSFYENIGKFIGLNNDQDLYKFQKFIKNVLKGKQ